MNHLNVSVSVMAPLDIQGYCVDCCRVDRDQENWISTGFGGAGERHWIYLWHHSTAVVNGSYKSTHSALRIFSVSFLVSLLGPEFSEKLKKKLHTHVYIFKVNCDKVYSYSLRCPKCLSLITQNLKELPSTSEILCKVIRTQVKSLQLAQNLSHWHNASRNGAKSL